MTRGLRAQGRRFILPLVLLGASLLDWNLISLTNLLIFLAIQLSATNRGSNNWRVYILSWCTFFFSLTAIVAQIVFNIVWLIEENDWKVDAIWWEKVVGFVRIQTMGSRSVILYIVTQLSAGLIAFVEVHENNDHGFCFPSFSSTVEQIGSHVRILCCLLLPAVQLVVGISRPSWISFPFFACSCVGLVDWSITSKFCGLFRWWRLLLVHACFSIFLLFTYQLPLELPSMAITVADFIGLYKIDKRPEFSELCFSISLLVYFFLLSSIKCNLDEMDSTSTLEDYTLTEQLLYSRSGVSYTNMVFHIFSIKFITFGFPVLLIALFIWSFSFSSICGFGLLAYVGYVLFTFPSSFKLQCLNGLLLVFILLWAVGTYIFNIVFTSLNKELRKDMEIWETIGFWHYPIPGLFLFAQFCLGVFVAIYNVVDPVFLDPANEGNFSLNANMLAEDKGDTNVLKVATLACGLHKYCDAITLALIFARAMMPGYINVTYGCFILLILLSHSYSRKIYQVLVLFCGAHFFLLYLLQLVLISNILQQRGYVAISVLSNLGITTRASFWEVAGISALLYVCAIQIHGLKLSKSPVYDEDNKKEFDLYAYIFSADLTVFFLIAFSYKYIVKGIDKHPDVLQLEDLFPKKLVYILMVLFISIILDRIIYLYSCKSAKIILYTFSILHFTYSVIGCMWPSYTSIGGFAVRIIILTKLISFALQAKQLRYGITNRITLCRHFFTRKVSRSNLYGFKLYRAIPYFYELRCVLDWSFTSSHLTLYEWLKLEDIYTSLFLVKCNIVLNEASHKSGQKQSKKIGRFLFFILICVIWSLILMYSSENPSNATNLVKGASIQIDIKFATGELRLFYTDICEMHSYKFLEIIEKGYLDTFNNQDIQLICCHCIASSTWTVPSLLQQMYIKSLNDTAQFIFTWVFLRERPQRKENVKLVSFVQHRANDFIKVLNGAERRIRLLDIYSRYFRIYNSGEVRSIESYNNSWSGDLFLNHINELWWSFYDVVPLGMSKCNRLSGPAVIVVSEETPGGIIGGILSNFSAWSLFITFVLSVGLFV